MKGIVVLFSVLIIAACGNSEDPEVIDLKDVLPSSERYNEGDTVDIEEKKVVYYDSLPALVQKLADTLGFGNETIDSIPETWFPDRFENLTAEKWMGRIGESIGCGAFYTFSDSLGMKNTLFNWLDSFGKKRNTLLLFEEKKLIANAFIVYATEKKIIYFESESRIKEVDILENLKRLFTKEEVLYVITQNVNNKTTWWALDEEEWTEIEKEEE